jgi:hypothetical protein
MFSLEMAPRMARVATLSLALVAPLAAVGGTFTQETWSTTSNGWGGVGYNWSGDFDGDGRADLASNYNNMIWVKRSTGSATSGFVQEEWLTTAGHWGTPGWVWIGDFNGDGKADIATAASGCVFVYVSKGTSFIEENWSCAEPHWGGSPDYNFVGDFNGDGRADIASAYNQNVWVHLSKPDPTGAKAGIFVEQQWSSTAYTWGGGGWNWAADFDGDGKTDIASSSGSTLVVHRSMGNSFRDETWSTQATHWGGTNQWNWLGDFDGDGRADIVSSYGGPATLWVHHSTGSSFTEESWLTNVPVFGGAGWTWVGDFNADGRTDLVTAVNANLYVFRSYVTPTSTNAFTEELWSSACPSWGGNPAWVWLGDFTGDGRTDIATSYNQTIWVKKAGP